MTARSVSHPTLDFARSNRRGMRGLVLLVAALGWLVAPVIVAESSASALDSYMQEVLTRAEREPAIPDPENDELSRLFGQAQNHAEAGRFREAAASLRPLLKVKGLETHLRSWVQDRVNALDRLERAIEPAAMRAFFVEANPRWFDQRLKPVAMAWRMPTRDSAARLQLVADMFQLAKDRRGQRLAVVALVDSGSAEPAQMSDALLDAGILAHEDRDVWAAVQAWDRVVRQYPRSPAWFKALYNLGIVRMEQHAFGAAIAHFTQLIESRPPDREPGAHIMENYRSYSHYAALGRSGCHEALGEFQAALQWAERAALQYPLESWCGTCAIEASDAHAKRVERLKARAAAKK